MKTKIALSAALLSLLCASGAQAQLIITLDPPSSTTFFGGDVAFGGKIINPTGSLITVDGDGFTGVPAFIEALGDFQFGNLPLDLTGGGGSFTSNDLFELKLNGAPAAGTYQLFSNNSVVGTITFPTQVPEPGSIALLAASGVGGGLFLARRRRK